MTIDRLTNFCKENEIDFRDVIMQPKALERCYNIATNHTVELKAYNGKDLRHNFVKSFNFTLLAVNESHFIEYINANPYTHIHAPLLALYYKNMLAKRISSLPNPIKYIKKLLSHEELNSHILYEETLSTFEVACRLFGDVEITSIHPNDITVDNLNEVFILTHLHADPKNSLNQMSGVIVGIADNGSVKRFLVQTSSKFVPYMVIDAGTILDQKGVILHVKTTAEILPEVEFPEFTGLTEDFLVL